MNKLLLIVTLVVSIGHTMAQTPKDYNLWTGFNYTLKLNDQFSLNAAPEIRLNDTIHSVNSLFSDFGLKFKINNYLAVKGNYRYSIRPAGKNDKQRVNLDLLLSLKKKKFPLSFRYRLRGQYSDELNSAKNEIYLRNQFKFDYNLSKLVDPYFSFELFFKFRANEFRNMRYILGLDWNLMKNLSLTTFYGFEREIYIKNPTGDHILGIYLAYQMKLKKKESKSSID